MKDTLYFINKLICSEELVSFIYLFMFFPQAAREKMVQLSWSRKIKCYERSSSICNTFHPVTFISSVRFFFFFSTLEWEGGSLIKHNIKGSEDMVGVSYGEKGADRIDQKRYICTGVGSMCFHRRNNMKRRLFTEDAHWTIGSSTPTLKGL